MKFYLSGGWDARGGKKRGWRRRTRGRTTGVEETGEEGTERRMKNGRICPYDDARFVARKDFESKIDYYEVM